jgi:hypothetical protein
MAVRGGQSGYQKYIIWKGNKIMAIPEKKSPAIDTMLQKLPPAGLSRPVAITNDICSFCGKPATQFKDDLSKREYRLSGMCQRCQDGVFVRSEEEE